MLKRTSLFSLIIIILASCAGSNDVVSNGLFQKRKYLKGFYTEKGSWNISLSENKAKLDMNSRADFNNTISFKNDEVESFELEYNPTVDSDAYVNVKNDDCGDTLMFITGKYILVNVIEVTEDKIRYTKCDDNSDREYSLSKNEAGYINYANGEQDFFNDPDARTTKNRKEKKYDDGVIKDEPLALPAIILVGLAFFLGLFILPVVGMGLALLGGVFGFLSFQSYQKDPEKYTKRSKALAVIAMTVGGVFFILFTAIFIQNL